MTIQLNKYSVFLLLKLKQNIMKTLVLLAILGTFIICGCDNSTGTIEKSSDKMIFTQTVEVVTMDTTEYITCDNFSYTTFQSQGLILFLNGETVKWVTPDNLKSFRKIQ
jgi:hypothetical protein